MNDALFVRRFERFRDLSGDRQRFIERQGPRGPGPTGFRQGTVFGPCQPFRQRVPFHQLEDQGSNGHLRRAYRGVVLFEPVDAADVRMIEGGQQLRFAPETGDTIGIAREDIGKQLDRHVAIEPGIATAIYLPHAAGADRRDDLVRSQASADLQWQRRVSDVG